MAKNLNPNPARQAAAIKAAATRAANRAAAAAAAAAAAKHPAVAAVRADRAANAQYDANVAAAAASVDNLPAVLVTRVVNASPANLPAIVDAEIVEGEIIPPLTGHGSVKASGWQYPRGIDRARFAREFHASGVAYPQHRVVTLTYPGHDSVKVTQSIHLPAGVAYPHAADSKVWCVTVAWDGGSYTYADKLSHQRAYAASNVKAAHLAASA